jgi:hypothetical protein
MRERMKFVVPFTIPRIRWTFVAISDSRSTLTTGIAAHTDASKRNCTPAADAFARDELLVRGHDRFPGPEKLADVAARRLQSAHHLRHNVDRGVVANRREVGRQDAVVGGKAPLLRGIADERANDAQPVAGRTFDLVAALGQHAADRRADGAVSQKRNAYVN